MTQLSVLVFDIEVFPMLAHVWDKGEQYVGLDQIEKDWNVAAWGAKWLGDPPSKIIYRDTSKNRNVRNDRNILEELWPLLDKADVVITQNGIKFDSRKLNARFMELGMQPPSPYEHIDTFKAISKVAAFTSSSLEYLTNKLCTKYKKLSHSKYPGLKLWKECLKGNSSAWAEMKKYNIHDVLSTEELYLKTRAWFPKSTPPICVDNGKCTDCGSDNSMKRGYAYTSTLKIERLRCNDCGKWRQGVRTKKEV